MNVDKKDSLATFWYGGNPMLFGSPDGGTTNQTGVAAIINVPVTDGSSYDAVVVSATPIGLGKTSSRVTAGIGPAIESEVELPPTP